jgi:hypothetical protein
VYSTCLFCNESLGNNESVEAFPVGRRLAFDQNKGRLWVVCPKCERWNLTPLEERWEAIEQSEKLYRDTRRRVATDQVGLARLRDGTTLVRIGEPLRPEFAAWRYGDQFGRRRNRQLWLAAGGIAAVGALFTGVAAAGIGVGGFAWMFANSGKAIIRGNPEAVVAKISTERNGIVHVRRRHLAETSISRSDDGRIALDLRFKNGSDRFVGREAERIASIILPKVNRYGGSRKAVAEAVEEIEREGSAEGYLDRLTSTSSQYTRPARPAKRFRRSFDSETWRRGDKGLYGLPGPHRLALEMALHEEAERRAMQGELEELERAWREAEEIAGISDNLFVPASVTEAFDKLKRGSSVER